MYYLCPVDVVVDYLLRMCNAIKRTNNMKMYFRNEFERDLAQAYHRVIRDSGKDVYLKPRYEFVSQVVMGGAPKFYITYEMARRNVSALLRGKCADCRNKLKMQMYADIARLTIDYQRRHKSFADDFNGALMTILSEYPAPRFYITEKSAYNLLCAMQRKYRNMCRKNLSKKSA